MPIVPMGQEDPDDPENEKIRRHEGFCPGCQQPIFNGRATHLPHCPYMKNDYDTPDEPGTGWW